MVPWSCPCACDHIELEVSHFAGRTCGGLGGMICLPYTTRYFSCARPKVRCIGTEIASLNCEGAVDSSTQVLSVQGPHAGKYGALGYLVPCMLHLQLCYLGSDPKAQGPARAATMPNGWVHVCKQTSATDYGFPSGLKSFEFW